MSKLTLDEYLALHGYSSPVDFHMIDKIKLPHGETQRQKEKRENEINAHSTEYHAERKRLIKEYNQKVENGEIVVPSRIEQTIATAKYGHPDNAATQAAIRILLKRGYTLNNQGEWVNTEKEQKMKNQKEEIDRIIQEIKQNDTKNISTENVKDINMSAKKQLYLKVCSEQQELKDWLLKQDAKTVLDHSYEYISKEDILYAIDADHLSEEQASVLLKLEYPLETIYEDYLKQDSGPMADILDVVIQRTNKLIEKEYMNPSERIFKTDQKIGNECNTETISEEQQEQPKKHKGRRR